MIKQLVDTHFAGHYKLGRVVTIDENHTTDSRFDLNEHSGTAIVAFSSGSASFENDARQDITVLDYEGYIDKYTGTQFHTGRMKCDCILESETRSTVILDEITTSVSGIENLQKPITGKKEYPGGKFEKVEQQLLVSLKTLYYVPEIAIHLDSQLKRVCLCSYKLYTSSAMAFIGDPITAFTRGMTEAERQSGGNGVKISCPKIEALGFEYRRISHAFAYSI